MEIKLAFSKKPLREAVASYNEDASVRKAFFEAGNSISSDGDHQQELVSLAQKQGIGAETLAASPIPRTQFTSHPRCRAEPLPSPCICNRQWRGAAGFGHISNSMADEKWLRRLSMPS